MAIIYFFRQGMPYQGLMDTNGNSIKVIPWISATTAFVTSWGVLVN